MSSFLLVAALVAQAQTAAAVRRLWEREEPHAAEGNARAARGDAAGALEAYGAAESELPEKGEAWAALALDRASALLFQGAAAAPRALEEARRAQQAADPAIRSAAAYDAALALEASGRTEDAIRGYAAALEADPADIDSKVNLELLLRREERQKKAPAARAEEKKDPQASSEPRTPNTGQGKDPASKSAESSPGPEQPDGPGHRPGPAQAAPAQRDSRQPPDPPDEKESRQGAAPEKAAPPRRELAGEGGRLDRSEAERLLDALRAGEKNLEAWRFGKRARDQKRRATERDW